MSLLRITLRLIVGVDIHLDYPESGGGSDSVPFATHRAAV
jgi:hypothetical protein